MIVADDAVLFREGTARLLSEAGLEVVGVAANVGQLHDLVRRDPPDVAVIDIRMPPSHSTEGIDAAAVIRAQAPGVGLLLLSQHIDTEIAVRLMTEFDGGVGYLLKDRVADLTTFVGDVRRVGSGDSVIDPDLVARLVAKKREDDPLYRLTARERDVLALMARGFSNRGLADGLYLSEKTVEAHVRNIFTKLDLQPDPDGHRRVLAVLAFLRS